MGSSWLVLIMVAAIFISMVLLAVVCLDCRMKGPPVSISQAAASDEYMPSTNFRVIHPSQPSIGHIPPSNWLSPSSSLVGTQGRQPSFTATETESNPSYENPADGPDYINESDQDDPGYIIVLPDGETPLTNQSRASTPSSDVQHDYENIQKSPKDDRDYLNVEPPHPQRSTSDLSVLSSSSSSSSSSDDEGNYVNQPPMLHSEPSA
ncbi:uncharacterized protein LOC117832513 [Notolabrus celidotus]|uniref:uncharacterized protein LOC117832513 n=1 Tax=Notolabrus celidotus TaxID=1203425 RepID=UPI001490805B|nr:uncharacterized protein LOC117832513 [Notolabrus celidotus]